jgi:hypothetical protein
MEDDRLMIEWSDETIDRLLFERYEQTTDERGYCVIQLPEGGICGRPAGKCIHDWKPTRFGQQ